MNYDLELTSEPVDPETVHTMSLRSLPDVDDLIEAGICPYERICWFGFSYPLALLDDEETICGGCDSSECLEFRAAFRESEDYVEACICGADGCECALCSCGQRGCRKWSVKKHAQKHWPISTVFLYPGRFTEGAYQLATWEVLVLPENFSLPSLSPSPYGGHLYAVAPNPDLSLHRLKFGWTSSLAGRLKAYRTLCPRSLVLGLWPAPKTVEDELHRFVGGRGDRFRHSEVFDLWEPFETLAEIANFLDTHRASWPATWEPTA